MPSLFFWQTFYVTVLGVSKSRFFCLQVLKLCQFLFSFHFHPLGFIGHVGIKAGRATNEMHNTKKKQRIFIERPKMRCVIFCNGHSTGEAGHHISEMVPLISASGNVKTKLWVSRIFGRLRRRKLQNIFLTSCLPHICAKQYILQTFICMV